MSYRFSRTKSSLIVDTDSNGNLVVTGVQVNGSHRSDVIITGSGDDVINGGGGNDLIISGSGDDVVNGGSGHDVIFSGSGDDVVSGGSGNDYVNSGSGDDVVSGDSGHDVLITGSGDDIVSGNSGHDFIATGTGNDQVMGHSGSDLIIAGSGDDVIDAGTGDDLVIAGSGNDTVNGGDGHDVILGQSGNDVIDGGAGWDYIRAGADDDIVTGGTGADFLDGGSGNDIAVFAGNSSEYQVVQITSTCYEVHHLATGEIDTVVNFETYRFDNGDFSPEDLLENGNDAPIAIDDIAAVAEDSSVIIDVLANDTDADGDSLTVTSASATTGSVTINADGTISYTPPANFNGSDTITYSISDGNGGTATASVSVTVNAVNDGPVAVNDIATTDEDTGVVIDVLSNDSDLDGDSLTVETATAANGSVTINADGTLTYTPAANFNGSDTITYSISDGNGGTATASVSVTVNAVNDGPVALDDIATTDEDTAVVIDVLANDSDLDGDSLTVDTATSANGSVTINADGTLTYTPAANFNGSDTITYSISDGNGGTATASVSVTVNAVNDGPVAVNDVATTDEDTAVTIDVLTNDSDLDGDSLSVDTATAANGSVTINVDGTLTYTPAANFNGSDTITYSISDGNGGTATASVSVTVNAVNDGPVAVNDVATTDEDTAVTIDVLTNDSDLDGDSLTVDTATAANGTVIINADGTLTYTPIANFNGSDTITYSISDGNGGTATASVSVTVNAVNDGPVAVDDVATTDEDTGVVIDVLSNDSDLDGDSLTVETATAANGSVTINVDGSLTYTPAANFNGSDTITYSISDGNGGTATASVSVTVNAVNDGPVAVDDVATTDEDTAVVIDVLSNDSDLDGDSLTVDTATAANGAVTINADGTLTYTPAANFNGSDTITYSISDGNGGTATASVSVTVNAINDGPVAVDDIATTDEDTAVVIDVLSNDSDLDGDSLSVDTATAANGSVTINVDGTLTYTPAANFNGSDTITYSISDGNGGTATASVSVTVNAVNDGPVAVNDVATTDEDTAVTIDVLTNDSDLDGDSLTVETATAANGSVTINVDGTLTYTPAANFNGSDTITYSISDGNGGTATASVSVTVNAVNDGPVAVDDVATTEEDTAVVIDVLSNDSDLDGDSLTVDTATAANGSVTINVDGTLTYTPAANFNGSDTIIYSISDGNGGTATASVSVTVNAVNDGPVAVDDVATTDEDTALTIDVLSNDSDLDGDSLTVETATAANGSVTINADGTLTYTPAANFNGSDTITYSISDGNGGTATASVSVTVNAVEDLPVASDDTAVTDEDTSVVIDVLSNDIDPDGGVLSVANASAANGSIVINPDSTLTYTPHPNFSGVDQITYEITNQDGQTSVATVTVTVNSTNDVPEAVDDVLTVDEDSSDVIDVLANDVDADGDALTVVSATASNGTVVIGPDGTLSYTPTAEFSGNDVISYTIRDTDGQTSSAQVTVTVNPVNDAPEAVDDVASTLSDTPVNIDVLQNDTDIEADSLSITSATALNGVVAISAGILVYTPASGFTGVDTISYQISDGNGGTSQASVSVTVDAPQQPVAVDDTADVDEDGAVTIDILGNDSTPNPGALIVNSAAAANGSVSINPDGTITYTPNENFEGTDTILYEVGDGFGLVDTAEVTVTVAPQNDAPEAVDDFAETNESQAVTFDVLSNDIDIDGDNLTVVSASANNGSVVINPDGTLTYTPQADFNGVELINYEVSDPSGETSEATVRVTVNAVNINPVALDDVAETDEDTPVTIDVLVNDSDADPNDTIRVSSASAANGDVEILLSGEVLYTPNAQFSGTDTITYTITDSDGGQDQAQVVVTVNPVNDAPDADDDILIVSGNGPFVVDVLANDIDLEGSALTVISASANNGTVTINPDGTLTYTPGATFSGTDFITYEVTDGELSTTATVSVIDPNDAPVAEDDLVIVDNSGAAISIDVLGNDSDSDGDALTVVSANANNGSVVIEADGSLTYTPNPGFVGGDVITYEITDGEFTSTGTVVINDRPIARDDSVVVNEDTSITIDALVNDSDSTPDSLEIIDATAGVGSVVINSAGQLVYTSASNFNGATEITYTISDGNGGEDSATISVNVLAVNDAPVAVSDDVSIQEDQSVLINVLANDFDVDGDAITLESFSALNGDTVLENGQIRYTPSANFSGTDTISYEISDGQGGTATATVTVTVSEVNDAPQAGDDTATTNEDVVVTINVLPNDTDVDSDSLAILSASAQNGSVSINSDGTLEYTPFANFFGTDSITYVISDGNGGSDFATVAVTVNPVNDVPDAQDDLVDTNQDQSVTLDVLANDSDVEGDVLSVSSAVADNGQVTINADGTITYTPNTGFFGVDLIEYDVSDAQGGVSSAQVTVLVNSSNSDVTAIDDSASGLEDTSFAIDVLANDLDSNNSALTLISASAQNGSTSINADGTLQYTPDADFNGVDLVEYVVQNSAGGFDTAQVSIVVNPVNDAPEAFTDSATASESVLTSITGVLDNDVDVDSANLSLVSATAVNGTVSVGSNGELLYRSNDGFFGTDAISYVVTDDDGATDTGTVLVTVSRNDGSVVAVNDNATYNLNTLLLVPNVLNNDTDAQGGELSIAEVGGSIRFDGLTQFFDGDKGGTFRFDANSLISFSGGDDFAYLGAGETEVTELTYIAVDQNGNSDSAKISVTVIGQDGDSVTANDDTVSQMEDESPLSFNVLSNDSDNVNLIAGVVDSNNDLSVFSVNGSELNVGATIAGSNGGSFTLQSDGSVVFDQGGEFDSLAAGETVTTSIDYVTQGFGGEQSSASVQITITGVNDAPVALDDSYVAAGSVSLFDLTDSPVNNDSDVENDTLVIAELNGQSNFQTLTGFGFLMGIEEAGSAGGIFQVYGNQTFLRFATLDDFAYLGAGETVDTTVQYTVSDGNGGTDTATITLSVTGEDGDAVTANDDVFSQIENEQALSVNLLDNDDDNVNMIAGVVDNTFDLSVLSVNGSTANLGVSLLGSNGGQFVVNADGSMTFEQGTDFDYLAAGETVTTSISYVAEGFGGETSEATVQVTVTGVNDNPVAFDDSLVAAGNVTLFSVANSPLSNDFDVDSDSLTISALNGDDSIQNISLGFFTLSGLQQTGTNGGLFQSYGNRSFIRFDSDDDFDYLGAGESAETSVEYTISDGDGGEDTATITVTVNGVNDGPVATDDSATVVENAQITIDVLSNDSDVDVNDVLTIDSIDTSALNGGSVIDNGDGTLTFDTAGAFDGLLDGEVAEEYFEYTISDGNGGFDTAQVLLTIQGATAPAAPASSSSTSELDDGSGTVDDGSDSGTV